MTAVRERQRAAEYEDSAYDTRCREPHLERNRGGENSRWVHGGWDGGPPVGEAVERRWVNAECGLRSAEWTESRKSDKNVGNGKADGECGMRPPASRWAGISECGIEQKWRDS